MPLQPSTRLGPYEISASIGAGGMGEVYRALDTNLGRQVAIKILPDTFAQDPERLARFEREARTLASLNHPNIAQIYGLEKGDGVRALVMELVGGPTLADRIAQGPIPIDEALPIAKQIAEALEAAHEQGIIHRDLKPANIKLRPDGTVKVLDFGLAKALGPPEGGHYVQDGRSVRLQPDLTASPTITSPAMMTGVGMLLGTAAYMSPEQARGKLVDKRSDIWAFGCVLYEMLSGQRAFGGEDVTDTLAAVVRAEPAWDALPASMSPSVRVFVRRCLQKNPKQRLHDVADMRLALEGAFETGAPQVTPSSVARSRWRRALPVAIASAVTAVVVGVLAWSLWPSVEPQSVSRFTYRLPTGQVFRNLGRSMIAISPDGRQFVYNTNGGIYLRSMDGLESRLIRGTEEVVGSPVFSPDGQWVAFVSSATSQLKKIPVAGGTPVVLAKANNPFGVSWGPDNTILFVQPEGIMRVSANGGTPELLIAAEKGEQLDSPQMLPDGRWVLFSLASGSAPNRWDVAEILAHSFESGERKVLWRGGSHARYVPTGHLIFALADGLSAIPFDLERMEVSGGPRSLIAGVQRATNPMVNSGAAQYALSDQGTLVYVAGGLSLRPRHLVWVDRRGQASPVVEQEAVFTGVVRISPDGQRITATISDGANEDIWVIDPARGARTRLTFGAERDIFPIWTPDGARVTFTSARRGAQNLYWTHADGSGMAEPLTESKNNQGANSWSPNGRELAFHEIVAGTSYDLWILAAGKEPAPFLRTPFRERGAAFSPDGRWLAYSSDESGREEVYIQSYPGPGGKFPISTDGGRSPRWSLNGRELFYRNGNRMMAVTIEISNTLRAGVPRLLFEGDFVPENDDSGATYYDVAADGRFLMTRPVASETREVPQPQIDIILNWTEELKRLVPAN